MDRLEALCETSTTIVAKSQRSVGYLELRRGGQAREGFAYPKKRDHEQRRNNHEAQDQVVEPIEPGNPRPSRSKIERCVGEPRNAVADHDGIGHEDSSRQ